jgi:aminopeptidase YwaD
MPATTCNSSAAPADNLRRHLEVLGVAIGERHLGSEGEARTIDYLQEQFAAAGYETVLEPFAVPGWRYGDYHMRWDSGEAIACFPCYYSPGGKVHAPLVVVDPTAPDFRMPDLKGRVALVGNFDFQRIGSTNALAVEFERAGAEALVFNSPYNDTYSTKVIRNPGLQRMPVFTVSLRTALRMAAREGENVYLGLQASRFTHTTCNVVGRYVPRGRCEGKMVIGGHYDTAPGIPGAADNGTGTALTLHLASRLRDRLGSYAVDFVAFGAEEYAAMGGKHYVALHAGELDSIRVMLNLDDIGTLLGRPEARIGHSSSLRSLVRRHTRASGIRITPFRGGSDNAAFHRLGIPNVWFYDGGSDTGIRHFPLHSPQDAIGLIDWKRFAAIAADLEGLCATLLTEGLAPDPPAEIKDFEPGDLAAATELARQVWTMGLACTRERSYGRRCGAAWQDRIEASVREYFQNPGVRGLKVCVQGEFAGFLGYQPEQELTIGTIGYNAVNPRFAGRGLAKALLQEALLRLRGLGIDRVEVLTGLDEGHAAARAVYESAGFVPLQSSIRYTLDLRDWNG